MNIDNVPSFKLKEKWEKIVTDGNVKLEVIAEDPEADSYRLGFLRDHLSQEFNNHLYSLNTENYDKIKNESIKDGENFHFTVVDGVSYRFEYDVEEHKAYLNFNDIKTTQRLEGFFSDLKGSILESDLSVEPHPS